MLLNFNAAWLTRSGSYSSLGQFLHVFTVKETGSEDRGKGILFSLNTRPGFWRLHTDRMTALKIKKAKFVINYVPQDICCDLLG